MLGIVSASLVGSAEITWRGRRVRAANTRRISDFARASNDSVLSNTAFASQAEESVFELPPVPPGSKYEYMS